MWALVDRISYPIKLIKCANENKKEKNFQLLHQLELIENPQFYLTSYSHKTDNTQKKPKFQIQNL